MGRPPCCASEPSLHAIALTCAGRVPSIRATYSRNNAATFVRQYWPHEYCMIGAAIHASAAAFPSAWRHCVSAANCARVRTTIRTLGCCRKGIHHSTQWHASLPARRPGTGGSGWWDAYHDGGLRPARAIRCVGHGKTTGCKTQSQEVASPDATIIPEQRSNCCSNRQLNGRR